MTNNFLIQKALLIISFISFLFLPILGDQQIGNLSNLSGADFIQNSGIDTRGKYLAFIGLFVVLLSVFVKNSIYLIICNIISISCLLLMFVIISSNNPSLIMKSGMLISVIALTVVCILSFKAAFFDELKLM